MLACRSMDLGVLGEVNIILDPDAKMRCRPHRATKDFDFASHIDNNYGVADAEFV